MRKSVFVTALCLLFLSAVSPGEMKKDAEKRISANAGDFKAVFNLGYANYQLNDYKASLENFRRALVLAPDRKARAMVRYNMGNIFFMQKKIKEAIREYRSGLRLTPDDKQLQYNYTVAKSLRKGKSGKKNNKNNKSGNKKNKDQKKNKGKQNKKDRSGSSNPQGGKDKKTPGKKRTGVMKKEDARRILEALKQREAKRIKARQFKAKRKSYLNRKEW